jgi:hypothetical protein
MCHSLAASRRQYRYDDVEIITPEGKDPDENLKVNLRNRRLRTVGSCGISARKSRAS